MRASHCAVFAMVVAMAVWLSRTATRADALDLWQSRDSGATNALNATAYGNGVWIAVGGDGTILTSTDGLAWARRPSGTTKFLNSAIFESGLFVVVGESGTVLTSANGSSWIRRDSGTTDFLYDVSYGNGAFIAVSDVGTVLSSVNGFTWTHRDTGTPHVYGVAYGNDRFVAVGGDARFHADWWDIYSITSTSADGVTWTQPSVGLLSARLSDLVFGNNTFVAVGESGSIVTSTNGLDWAKQNPGRGDSFLNVAFGDGTFVVVGAQWGTILASTNGIDWTRCTSAVNDGLLNVGYGGGTFIAVGNSGTILQSRYLGPPVMGSPRLLADGSAAIAVKGRVDRTYRFQSSATLAATDWADVEIFTQTNEVESVIDSGSANASARFYRVVSLP